LEIVSIIKWHTMKTPGLQLSSERISILPLSWMSFIAYHLHVGLIRLGEFTSRLCAYVSGFGGLVVRMLASGTQDRGFAPGRSRQIFSGKKSPQHAFLRKGSKAVCPMSQICGMSKEPYNLLWKSQVIG
jgi:hypothetical protein